MRKYLALGLAVLFLAATAYAVSVRSTKRETRVVNFVNGLAVENGADPGAKCIVGEIFIDTDETVDTNCTTTADNSLCLCTATDTWTALENN